jgi:hypothetical protein
LQHNDKRKRFIEEMDKTFLKVEDDRVEKVSVKYFCGFFLNFLETYSKEF